ncbi:hypothetical protein Rvan_2046 [Rhodomicrobium vannielii ATCC 17100]|uniref:Uncharacterized protein n=1 Tax=Rhodomicrobium vannielii (strain ATCC 17100 / DSM 162 / LMG 4299 / NCIMB 10020 / ATH 3.1.1) TaxID=648757 RepID=E3I1I3_RHOVT|nr:hypothetical protein [Rhodomicrobium vannielii]ADP71274.1 hypothetical protein Rvan_2046 [Rhodomicrobium vannielii ATCC 17100]
MKAPRRFGHSGLTLTAAKAAIRAGTFRDLEKKAAGKVKAAMRKPPADEEEFDFDQASPGTPAAELDACIRAMSSTEMDELLEAMAEAADAQQQGSKTSRTAHQTARGVDIWRKALKGKQ